MLSFSEVLKKKKKRKCEKRREEGGRRKGQGLRGMVCLMRGCLQKRGKKGKGGKLKLNFSKKEGEKRETQ